MARPVIHLLSIGGSDREVAEQLGLKSGAEIIGLVQDVVGTDYRVTGNPKLMDAALDPGRAGRRDDAARAQDLQSALSAERVAAIVSVRGGAWVTRILPRLRFDVLNRRKNHLHVFGFSELTPLVNILAGYSKVRACYDFGPGYLLWGLRNHALANYQALCAGLPGASAADHEHRAAFALGWAKAHFRLEFASFFLDVLDILAGRGTNREMTGECVRGRIRPNHKIVVAGGCLSTLVTLLGSPYQDRVFAKGRWVALEDVREEIYRIDRYLAQLKLAGIWETCGGLLLGDFHLGEEDQTAAILHLLDYHLPAGRRMPVIAGCNFGHCYPAAPLPIGRPVVLRPGRGAAEKIVHIIPGR